jgi:galactose-1-phosphate uridylyltransferase
MIDALVKEAGGKVEGTVASALVTGYINRVCANILRCTAVFKDDDAGVNAFEKFTRSAGFEIKK